MKILMKEKNILWILILLSLIIKSAIAIISYDAEIVTQVNAYLYFANQIVSGDTYAAFGDTNAIIVGPALPYLLAGFVLLFGNPVIPFFVFNIVMGTLLTPVVFYLGKIIFDKNVAWVMAIWALFFMEVMRYTPTILKEVSLITLIPLIILLLLRSNKEKSTYNFYMLGAALSYSFLIHMDERYLFFLPLFLVFFWFKEGISMHGMLKNVLVWCFIVFLTMTPWLIKNYQFYNQIVILTPRTTAFTSKIWGEDISGKAGHFSDENIRKELHLEGRKEEALKFGEKHGISPREYSIAEARFRAFKNYWQPTYFNPTYIQYGFRPLKWSVKHNLASLLNYGIFLPFYIIGLFMLFRKKHLLAFFIGIIPIIHSLLHAYMIWPLERYRSPITFIIVMIGVWCVIQLWKYVRSLSVKKAETTPA